MLGLELLFSARAVFGIVFLVIQLKRHVVHRKWLILLVFFSTIFLAFCMRYPGAKVRNLPAVYHHRLEDIRGEVTFVEPSGHEFKLNIPYSEGNPWTFTPVPGNHYTLYYVPHSRLVMHAEADQRSPNINP